MISCSTSNDVTSNRRIQKRKYNKGFFIDFDKKWNNGGNEQVAEVEVPVASQTTEHAVVSEVAVSSEVPTTIVQEEIAQSQEVAVIEAETPTTTPARSVSVVSNAQQNVVAVPSEEATKTVSIRNAVKAVKQVKKQFKKKAAADDMTILYYVLAFFIPFLAVGLVTDWDVKQVVINILLCCLCGIPGIIHAFIVVSRNV